MEWLQVENSHMLKEAHPGCLNIWLHNLYFKTVSLKMLRKKFWASSQHNKPFSFHHAFQGMTLKPILNVNQRQIKNKVNYFWKHLQRIFKSNHWWQVMEQLHLQWCGRSGVGQVNPLSQTPAKLPPQFCHQAANWLSPPYTQIPHHPLAPL